VAASRVANDDGYRRALRPVVRRESFTNRALFGATDCRPRRSLARVVELPRLSSLGGRLPVQLCRDHRRGLLERAPMPAHVAETLGVPAFDGLDHDRVIERLHRHIEAVSTPPRSQVSATYSR
jgi:hypothetical protein